MERIRFDAEADTEQQQRSPAPVLPRLRQKVEGPVASVESSRVAECAGVLPALLQLMYYFCWAGLRHCFP